MHFAFILIIIGITFILLSFKIMNDEKKYTTKYHDNKLKKEILNLIDQFIGYRCSIDEFENKVSWRFVCKNANLSELFIETFKHKIIWSEISKHQKLTENFIIKYKNFVNWQYIFKYQKLSNEFIEKYHPLVSNSY